MKISRKEYKEKCNDLKKLIMISLQTLRGKTLRPLREPTISKL
jgi:hypothetical protein